MEELPQLEKLFELNNYVYKFTKVGDEENKKKGSTFTSSIFQRCTCLNLYGKHFVTSRSCQFIQSRTVAPSAINFGNLLN